MANDIKPEGLHILRVDGVVRKRSHVVHIHPTGNVIEINGTPLKIIGPVVMEQELATERKATTDRTYEFLIAPH